MNNSFREDYSEKAQGKKSHFTVACDSAIATIYM